MINKNDLIKYDTNSGLVELDFQTIRNVIAVGNNITDSEVITFMQLCKYRKLNPFLKQVHLVKFKDKADIIVGIDVFTERLTNHKDCEGWECGVIVLTENEEIKERKGTFYLESEKLVGAYCNIKKKGWKEPFSWTIKLKDFLRTHKNKSTGKHEPMGQWRTMPGVMLTKCAIVSTVRKVFAEDFGGMYSAEEMGVESSNVIDAEFTEVKTLTSEQISKLKEIAKSNKKNVSYDSEKMVEFVINSLYDNSFINSNKIEMINDKFYEFTLKKIKETKEKTEDKQLKDLKNKEPKKEDEKKDNIKENDQELKTMPKVTKEQVNQLKEAAKSNKVKYDSEKLLDYVFDSLYKENFINSDKVELLYFRFFDDVLKKVKEVKGKKEDEDKNNKENKVNQKNKSINNDELPLPDKNKDIAKPATKNKANKEKEIKK